MGMMRLQALAVFYPVICAAGHVGEAADCWKRETFQGSEHAE
jgi:hypothetical protein